jgi:glycosyltransferase involved in cell wall biosynthesis
MNRPINADVIIPVTSANHCAYYAASVALRTCRASTSARVLALDNNGDHGGYQAKLKLDCENLGIAYHYVDGPFSISRLFNLGARMTSGEYIAYGTSDVIYFPDWMENIIEAFEEHPEYYCLTNFSYDADNMPCVKHDGTLEKKIAPTHNPSSGVLVLKRKDGYVWDEQFALWEIDADFLYFLEANNLKAGYCCNARCDHMIGSIRAVVDMSKHSDPAEADFGEAKRRVKEKWYKIYKGG